MRYCSTRGGVQGWDFRDVLFSGFAPDGGMFMPETLPVLSPDTVRSWRGLPYSKLVVEVSSLFIPAQLIPRDHLEALVSTALSGFSVPEVVRISRLGDSLSLLELFHGSTLAFKDLAMTCTVHFTNYFLQKEKCRAIVLVGFEVQKHNMEDFSQRFHSDVEDSMKDPLEEDSGLGLQKTEDRLKTERPS
ncbi:threonine synthase-like 2 [Nematolebias whitei]|uniref:threonine synthase-like 2 n=1 Tax=Nematolebias whitei TaxID=451745 RepID=UPI0018994C8F|nr:threonine synthase-like 2 [Nematolebias whitei]